jgi:hypothetical protein
VARGEQAHKLLDELPESEIDPVVEFIVSLGENGADDAEPAKDLSRLGGGEGCEVGLLESDEAAGELE